MRKFLIDLWHDLSKVNRTPQQQKNYEAIERWKAKQKQKAINFLNNNPLIIPFILGIMILSMTVIFALSIH